MKNKTISPKYSVIDHHSIWGWKKTIFDPEETDTIFIWNDFSFEDSIIRWQNMGKKIICFEHGYCAFFDYEYNHRKTLADGYLSFGKSSVDSLMKCGIDRERIFVGGNPRFDKIPIIRKTKNKIPKVLYTALHWRRDLRDYNNYKLQKIVQSFKGFSEITAKTIEKSKIDIPKGVSEWKTDINDNKDLFDQTIEGLKDFDLILTPKESTFDLIALKMHKRVFRIGTESEYRLDGEPTRKRSILPLSDISSDLLNQKSKLNFSLDHELSKSKNLKKILRWTNQI